MPLRPYQQDAVNAAINHMKTSVTPCLIDAATGAGKSHIIASIADWLHKKSNKKVIVLQPNKKLLQQNREKFLATGNPCSVYSASAGAKCLKHPVIFATPGTLKGALKKINAAGIVVDEAHGVTPTFKLIAKELRVKNPHLRIVGLTATPYRLGEGYIYKINELGNAVKQAKDPFFHKLVYRVPARDLIKQGYLTPPAIGYSEAGYKTITIANDQKELDRAVDGQGRKTSKIVADIVEQARSRDAVMIFAASVRHAKEIAASLPPALTGVVVDGQSKANDQVLEDFKNQKIKYLVNVNMLTTGYDADRIDCIALMRSTSSAALLIQMVGRGLRLKEGKLDCLVLDYAQNIERHAPDGDIFNPEITVAKERDSKLIVAICPDCNHENTFSVNKDAVEGMDIDENGYVIDLAGQRIDTEWGHQPAHYGRRCNGALLPTGDRCGYRWTFKECDKCGHENDIAARSCVKCKNELVDPNEKLQEDFIRRKQDPYAISTDHVKSWQVKKTLSREGNEMFAATFFTDYNTVNAYFVLKEFHGVMLPDTVRFLENTKNGTVKPETITYYKSGKFWKITDYNKGADEIS